MSHPEQSEDLSEQSEDLSEQSEGSFREYEGSWSRSDSRYTPAGFRMRPVVISSSARDLTLQLERKKDSRRSLEITMPGSLNSASSATCNAIGDGRISSALRPAACAKRRSTRPWSRPAESSSSMQATNECRSARRRRLR